MSSTPEDTDSRCNFVALADFYQATGASHIASLSTEIFDGACAYIVSLSTLAACLFNLLTGCFPNVAFAAIALSIPTLVGNQQFPCEAC
jgi:hypothetical protein